MESKNKNEISGDLHNWRKTYNMHGIVNRLVCSKLRLDVLVPQHSGVEGQKFAMRTQKASIQWNWRQQRHRCRLQQRRRPTCGIYRLRKETSVASHGRSQMALDGDNQETVKNPKWWFQASQKWQLDNGAMKLDAGKSCD